MRLNIANIPWLGAQYFTNRRSFPPEALEKFAGRYVAWSWDGSEILASGATMEQVEQQLSTAGIDPSRVVGEYVESL